MVVRAQWASHFTSLLQYTKMFICVYAYNKIHDLLCRVYLQDLRIKNFKVLFP